MSMSLHDINANLKRILKKHKASVKPGNGCFGCALKDVSGEHCVRFDVKTYDVDGNPTIWGYRVYDVNMAAGSGGSDVIKVEGDVVDFIEDLTAMKSLIEAHE